MSISAYLDAKRAAEEADRKAKARKAALESLYGSTSAVPKGEMKKYQDLVDAANAANHKRRTAWNRLTAAEMRQIGTR